MNKLSTEDIAIYDTIVLPAIQAGWTATRVQGLWEVGQTEGRVMELIINHVYSAKRRKYIGDMLNDRQILRIGPNSVQYDSPTIRDGRHYPTVTKEQFLRWAKDDVTAQMPPDGGWRERPALKGASHANN